MFTSHQSIAKLKYYPSCLMLQTTIFLPIRISLSIGHSIFYPVIIRHHWNTSNYISLMRRWLPLSATNLRIGQFTWYTCTRSEPFTRPPIHCMELSHSLNSLSSERAWPMYSKGNRVNGNRGSSARQAIGMLCQPAIISTSLPVYVYVLNHSLHEAIPFTQQLIE